MTSPWAGLPEQFPSPSGEGVGGEAFSKAYVFRSSITDTVIRFLTLVAMGFMMLMRRLPRRNNFLLTLKFISAPRNDVTLGLAVSLLRSRNSRLRPLRRRKPGLRH